jgi:pimeloyl-ACP methyl ester carboxylesterase
MKAEMKKWTSKVPDLRIRTFSLTKEENKRLDEALSQIYQVPEFSRDHTVITFDYRGMGQSSKPSTKYTMEMFADDAAAILDHLKLDQAIVCGHSMGGRVAQVLALKHPSKVKKLILASSGAGYPDQRGIPLKLCMEMVQMGYEKYAREHTVAVGWTQDYLKKHRANVEKFLQVRWQNMPTLECFLRHIIARHECDTRAQLKDIRVPTLVLVGAEDHISASNLSHRTSSEELAKGIPNAKLALLPGECHHFFYTEPAAAHNIIRDFLRES